MQLGAVYDQLEAMCNVAVMKDDLIEEMSAIEGEPELSSAPGDEPVIAVTLPSLLYKPEKSATSKYIVTIEPTTHTTVLEVNSKTIPTKSTQVQETTKQRQLPKELANPPAAGAHSLAVSMLPNYAVLSLSTIPVVTTALCYL